MAEQQQKKPWKRYTEAKMTEEIISRKIGK